MESFIRDIGQSERIEKGEFDKQFHNIIFMILLKLSHCPPAYYRVCCRYIDIQSGITGRPVTGGKG